MNRPPFETFKGPICKGSYALGSACGLCERCEWERNQIAVERNQIAVATATVPDFQKELEKLINRFSMENGSDTPDFLLAIYLRDCLATFNVVVQAREKWYGREKREVKAPANSTQVSGQGPGSLSPRSDAL